MEPEAVDAAERVPHGGETDPDLLDFSANINPRVPDGVEEIYRDALEASRRYPDDDYPDYREAAAEYVGCRPGEVIPTSGGLAAIRLALESNLEPDDEVLIPYPSFGEYAREVRLQGALPRFVRHDEILEAVPDRYALAIVCTPNNPTGEATTPDELAAFADRCRQAETTLLVDEAFLGFTDQPSMAGREGVVVARSLTKLFGLPGLRAGFAVATGELRERLETARPAWGLGTPAARVGTHCMRDSVFVRETRETVARERARMRKALEDETDLGVYPSDAPYLLCDVGELDVGDVLEYARSHGVALRDGRTFRALDSHVRIAVKDREANDRVLEVLLDACDALEA
ncbi:threonine-phosphate decarboxylase [Natrialbaceae archaeon A-gly3]